MITDQKHFEQEKRRKVSNFPVPTISLPEKKTVRSVKRKVRKR